ncbi:MAG TPA: Gfo/Idh/MocA family oxidoreductase [Thermomicrobiales bacterium]|nr:Gfo/Idh/MocA family oxidoreductase [Thermomicrobiales bacterium]
MSFQPLRAGILGAGTIATSRGGFLPGMMNMPGLVETVAIADPVVDRASSVAATFGIAHAFDSLDRMLDESDIDLVLNLTPIPLHASTSRAILEAGKHLVIEKPIATSLDEANELIALAERKGVTYVVAPPNLLDANRIEAKRLIDAGAIGKPCFARVRSSHGGPASGAWPLDPTWFYQEGSGPLLDMGVYGIHDITGLLGPARRVVAFSGISEPTRTVRGGPFKGKEIEVTTDDNTLLMLDFGESVFAVVDGTYNVNAARGPQIEIFGRAGTLNISNAHDTVNPALELYRLDAGPGVDGWIVPRSRVAHHSQDWDDLKRAVMVKHLAECVRDGTKPVLSAEHARHALEIMVKAIESARTGMAIDLATTF